MYETNIIISMLTIINGKYRAGVAYNIIFTNIATADKEFRKLVKAEDERQKAHPNVNLRRMYELVFLTVDKSNTI